MAVAIGTETGATIVAPDTGTRAGLRGLRSVVLPVGLALLALAAWQAVMQMDQNSTSLPGDFRMHLDTQENQLQIDVPTTNAVPTTPAGPADDFDLLGQAVNDGPPRAGAIQHLRPGTQTISLWPLPPIAQPTSATAK